jgi:hypothetical protein
VTLYGDGRAAIADDPATADALSWSRRKRSAGGPAIVFRRRDGDPTREPWIVPPGWLPREGASALWDPHKGDGSWRYLAGVAGVRRYLAALAAPPRTGGARVAIAGLGRVGGTAAALLMALPAGTTRLAELLIHDVDRANAERWLLELRSIAQWRRPRPAPPVRIASVEEMLRESDALVFAAAESVPPIGWTGDVRRSQFAPNREILAGLLGEARRADFSGLLLVVSDPVELLAQAAFHDSNADARGHFRGHGLAPERVTGLALGVMWARALACAREQGWEEPFRRHGGVFGPHGADIVAFDDLRGPNPGRSEMLTRAAREGNVRLRQLGHLPYVGPALSSVALTLPGLLAGRTVPVSPLVGGLYFGAPGRLQWGVYPTPTRMCGEVRGALAELHARLSAELDALGLAFRAR